MIDRYDDLSDLSSCSIDRPVGAGPGDGMLLVNHWLQENISGILFPQKCMAAVTNSEEYINRHVNRCQTTFGTIPNFILVSIKTTHSLALWLYC